VVTVTSTDEIYERYLKKAIAEINALWTELQQAGGGMRLPVVGSGHPLGDIFMLKHRPQPAELQEGVAFYGRAGQAVLKSLQRLHVDPLALYGTNCLKFGVEEPEEAGPWLERELHIVQPKLVVVMGPEALAFLNGLGFPLSRPLEETVDEQPAKTTFWNAFKQLGPWWAELPPY
jgi:uracil-DNA glycosylase